MRLCLLSCSRIGIMKHCHTANLDLNYGQGCSDQCGNVILKVTGFGVCFIDPVKYHFIQL